MVIAFPTEYAQYLQLLADNHHDCGGMPAPWNIPHRTQTHTQQHSRCSSLKSWPGISAFFHIH